MNMLAAVSRPKSNGYTRDEAAAIETAITFGKLTRIEQGNWPDAGRPEIHKILNPQMRKLIASKRKRS
jgi:hypothetical protein